MNEVLKSSAKQAIYVAWVICYELSADVKANVKQ